MLLNLPGINIQCPWAEMILKGEKVFETRTYPLPRKHVSKMMWLIETPGAAKDIRARVVGVVTFYFSKEYKTMAEWDADIDGHRCGFGSQFCWGPGQEKRRFGWYVSQASRLRESFSAAPMSRGVVYSSPYEAEVEFAWG